MGELKKKYILEFFDVKNRIVSDDILQNILLGFMDEGLKQKRFYINKITEFKYWIYILNIYNSNFIKKNSDKYHYEMLDIYTIAKEQIESLRFDGKICFEKVDLKSYSYLDSELILRCSDDFRKAINCKESKIYIYNSVRENYIPLL